jgi:hypothetical protein
MHLIKESSLADHPKLIVIDKSCKGKGWPNWKIDEIVLFLNISFKRN